MLFFFFFRFPLFFLYFLCFSHGSLPAFASPPTPDAQVGKAVNALMTYVENRGKGDGDKDGLFADDDGEFISIIFGLKRTPLRAKKTHRM